MTVKLFLCIALWGTFVFGQEAPENVTEINSKNIRRQVPAYAGPYYAPPFAAAAPAFAAPAFAAAPVFAAPVPAPAPVPPPAAPACAPSCIGGGACIAGACACSPPVVYNPVVGCAPPPPPPPAPVVTGRLIPQALPGAPCEPGVECTGGSVCSMGICLCPPELVQEGTVCVSRTIYGVVPPPPPPPPPAVVPAVAYPVPAPPPPAPVAAAPVPIPAGAPCVQAATPACVAGAYCDPRVGVCVRRRLSRKEQNDEEKPEEQ